MVKLQFPVCYLVGCDEKIDFILIHHLLSNKNNLFLKKIFDKDLAR